MSFHRRCGSRIHLSNLNRTARRNINDFNHGIVLSAEPIVDDVWFQIRIDEKVCVANKFKTNIYINKHLSQYMQRKKKKERKKTFVNNK